MTSPQRLLLPLRPHGLVELVLELPREHVALLVALAQLLERAEPGREPVLHAPPVKHRCAHLLGVARVDLHAERSQHRVDALHLRVVKRAHLAFAARLDQLGDLIEVRTDVL